MKIIIILFTLLSMSLYSIDYSAGVGVNLDVPIEIPMLVTTAKCGDCVRDISLEFQTGITFKNRLSFTESLDLNIDLSINHSLIRFENNPDRATSIELAILLNKNIDNFFVGGGLFGEKYIFTDKITSHEVFPVSFIFNLGYNFSDNFGLLLTTKMFKMIKTKTRTRGYILNSFSMFYYF